MTVVSRGMVIDVPCSGDTEIDKLLTKHRCLFKSVPALAYRHNPTTGNPVQIPPRQIPTHYKEEVECQIHQMLQKDVIEESSNPWMAPANFVQKKSGEICLCVDYHEPNKKTHKRCMPLTVV